ncbi:FAD-dependent oxidoreductase [Candidatus Woesearchaeota archaeon]|nr:FAD-dependent oxidoreductase [Candidatus Woesearchaeota archaeon]
MKKPHVYETIIVGGGIAGCTAAIYAARKKMDYLLLTKQLGGQFMESGDIFNYPGIKQISGADFSRAVEEQLAFNKVNVKERVIVNKIIKKREHFVLKTDGKDVLTKTIIIATGSHPRTLDVPGEREFRYKGVTYCAICDGPLFYGKEVAVVGGGNSALDAADSLLNIARKIYVINIHNKFEVHKYLLEKAQRSPKVRLITGARTTRITGNKFVSGIEYEQKGKVKKLDVQGVFVEIGRVPNTSLVKGFLELDEHHHIVIDCNTQTSVPGVFAAGDCSSVHEYQYVIAAGQGCIALLKAARYLARHKSR